MSPDAPYDAPYHAWNPGIESRIPMRLNHRITLFADGTSRVGYDEAQEAADFCGLEITRLADLTAERMVVHELLVRVTADLSVPDGPSYEYLGLSLRGMVERLHQGHLAPHMEDITAAYDDVRGNAARRMRVILAGAGESGEAGDGISESGPESAPKSAPESGFESAPESGFESVERLGFWKKLFTRPKAPPSKRGTPPPLRDEDRINQWRDAAGGVPLAEDAPLAGGVPLERACYAALAELGQAMITHRGRLGADDEALVGLALRLFSQDYGEQVIRTLVAPHFTAGVAAEGYRFLPPQDKRIIMNTKGASAAGKSTIRPHQRRLAESLGIDWGDFALISPDYWRKYLLDYDSLGGDYKYAGMLTGQELAVVDQKLDRYMAQKAARGDVPHLLIDRFRFDSFKPGSDGDYQSTLLTRFGDTVFMFFVITAPHETVERAWQRGLMTRRYKAVDDLLYHNIEAYTGIPGLFFGWTASPDKMVHFEFLNNDVAAGEDPLTMAFGTNRSMTIFDPLGLSRIDHYKSINIAARHPQDVLAAGSTPDYAFLRQCFATIPHIICADPHTGAIWGEYRQGAWRLVNADACPPEIQAAKDMLQAIGWPGSLPPSPGGSPPHDEAACDKTACVEDTFIDLEAGRRMTLGRWGAQ